MSHSHPERRIVCLFGSGISIPAGMPSTGCLNEKLLPPRGFYRWTDGRYKFLKPGDTLLLKDEKDLEAITHAVQVACCVTRDAWRRSGIGQRHPDYEDVVYTMEQIRACGEGGGEDSLASFAIPLMIEGLGGFPLGRYQELDGLLGASLHCIADLSCEMLRRKISCTDYLEMMSGMIGKFGADPVTVVTTNYDVVLETFFSDHKIPFDDGFTERCADARWWSPRSHFGREGRLQLVKLHGSINCYDMMPCLVGHGYQHATRTDGRQGAGWCPQLDGRAWMKKPGPPEILMGSFNKIDQYTSWFFADLFCRFRSALSETQALVIAGYGFRDYGINRLLLSWALRSSAHHTVVIDPEWPESLERCAPYMAVKLLEFQRSGVLFPIKNGIENVRWSEIEALIPD